MGTSLVEVSQLDDDDVRVRVRGGRGESVMFLFGLVLVLRLLPGCSAVVLFLDLHIEGRVCGCSSCAGNTLAHGLALLAAREEEERMCTNSNTCVCAGCSVRDWAAPYIPSARCFGEV